MKVFLGSFLTNLFKLNIVTMTATSEKRFFRSKLHDKRCGTMRSANLKFQFGRERETKAHKYERNHFTTIVIVDRSCGSGAIHSTLHNFPEVPMSICSLQSPIMSRCCQTRCLFEKQNKKCDFFLFRSIVRSSQ